MPSTTSISWTRELVHNANPRLPLESETLREGKAPLSVFRQAPQRDSDVPPSLRTPDLTVTSVDWVPGTLPRDLPLVTHWSARSEVRRFAGGKCEAGRSVTHLSSVRGKGAAGTSSSVLPAPPCSPESCSCCNTQPLQGCLKCAAAQSSVREALKAARRCCISHWALADGDAPGPGSTLGEARY